MREYEPLQLLKPTKITALGTGSYVDIQGIVEVGREAKFVLEVGVGTTVGTAGGIVQSASSTAGAGLATVCTFSTLTTVGGINTQHGVIPVAHRYVRFLGTTQAAKNMYLSCIMIARNRHSP